MQNKPSRILGTLTLLTSTLIILQIIFFGIHSYLGGMSEILTSALTENLHLLLPALLGLIGAQILIYALYIYLLWFTTRYCSELLSIQEKNQHFFAIIIWITGTTALLAANLYYVPHSFFSTLIRQDYLNDQLSDSIVLIILLSTSTLFIFMFCLAVTRSIARKKLLGPLFFGLMITALCINALPSSNQATNNANTQKPNIFIIGFDAVRPDYLSYFNKENNHTPAFDQFLNTSVVFNDAYTPLSRTFPSWTSILTAKYPLHHHVREDNTNIHLADLSQSLPAILKNAGYETIYASDDNRFSYINREFGFDRIIGNNGNIADFMMSSINDSLLSNLLIPTYIGKLLFPYNHGNHGYAAAYQPDNFINIIKNGLEHRTNKPLFMAVHFNVTAFPFYRFNNHLPYQTDTLNRYKDSIRAGDQMFAAFLNLIQLNGLLNHAIVVLISDHGITLAMPHDRVTSESGYQGNINDIRLKKTKYRTADQKTELVDDITHKGQSVKMTARMNNSLLDKSSYGIDTSFGYGSDVLSLKQNRSLLAFRIYGDKMLHSHRVNGYASLLDITPTILDLIGLTKSEKFDGITLQPYLLSAKNSIPEGRAIFLESGFSFPEIESDGIVIDNVAVKSYKLFRVNPINGIVSMDSKEQALITTQKQRAILQDGWLLAYYPASSRYIQTYDPKTKTYRFTNYIAPPYSVLVNLTTGQWAINQNHPFTHQAPYQDLSDKLHTFYGNEMKFYQLN